MATIETARIILLDCHKDVILPQRTFDSKQRAGQLDFFGGAVELGENPLQGGLREVLEESAMDVSGIAITPVYETEDHDGPDTFLRKYFRALVPRFPERLTEHAGAVVLPGVVALDLLAFAPHRMALSRALAIS
jgi:8-oxo-dGTP pyrophosphatase MutT (NUDIX family)